MVGPPHSTPASSKWEQSCNPRPSFEQLSRYSSLPVQETLSSQIGSTPGPKAAFVLAVPPEYTTQDLVCSYVYCIFEVVLLYFVYFRHSHTLYLIQAS